MRGNRSDSDASFFRLVCRFLTNSRLKSATEAAVRGPPSSKLSSGASLPTYSCRSFSRKRCQFFTAPREEGSRRLPSSRTRTRAGEDPVTVVYTDGSSKQNGDEDSRVGSGIWFGPNDQRNKSLRVQLPRATNQTGELVAVLVAAQDVPLIIMHHCTS